MTRLMPYPFGDSTGVGECGCKFYCFPQLAAEFDAAQSSRSKVGFAEFGTASTPPRRYLQKLTTTRYYHAVLPGYQLWERVVWSWDDEAETWIETTTNNFHEAPTHPDLFWSNEPIPTNGAHSEITLPTIRQTIDDVIYASGWISGSPWNFEDAVDVSGAVFTRVRISETLSNEYTTADLRRDVLAKVATWPAFPDVLGAHYGYTAPSKCYDLGDDVWDSRGSRAIVVGHWQLASNELSLAIQRVRYRIVFPKLLGAGSTFTVSWEEVFVPDDAEGPEDWIVLAHCTCTGNAADTVSNIIDLAARRTNGEVYVTNVRYTALSGAP